MADEAGATGSEAGVAAVADTGTVAAVAAPEAVAEQTLLGGDPPAEPVAAAPAEGEKPAADAIPETYAIAIPEGETLDQGKLDAYQGAMKEAGLTQGQADKLTPILFAQMQKLQTEQMAAWGEVTKGWREAVLADPDVGGSNLRASMVDAARARDTFGSPEFKTFLSDGSIGVGNHPELVKFMAKVGRAMGEDGRGLERQQLQTSGQDKSAAAQGARRFPNMTA